MTRTRSQHDSKIFQLKASDGSPLIPGWLVHACTFQIAIETSDLHSLWLQVWTSAPSWHPWPSWQSLGSVSSQVYPRGWSVPGVEVISMLVPCKRLWFAMVGWRWHLVQSWAHHWWLFGGKQIKSNYWSYWFWACQFQAECCWTLSEMPRQSRYWQSIAFSKPGFGRPFQAWRCC